MQPHVSALNSGIPRMAADQLTLQCCTCAQHAVSIPYISSSTLMLCPPARQTKLADDAFTPLTLVIGRLKSYSGCPGVSEQLRLLCLHGALPAVENMLPSLCRHCCASCCCCFSASALSRACSSRHRCCHQTSDLYRSPAPSWPAPTQQPPSVPGTGCNPLGAMAPAMHGATTDSCAIIAAVPDAA